MRINDQEGAFRNGYDLLGVGFGPANLALAVALAEQREYPLGEYSPPRLTATFLEQQERFAWHSGMLIDDSTMQVAFLKDLATIRNPTSRFSFLAYLAARERLVDFINQKDFFPTRLEFHDYFEWAASHFTELVEYSARVVNMRPVRHDNTVTCLAVDADGQAGGEARPLVRYARNVVVAAGLCPALPDGVTTTDRAWHSAELLPRLVRLTVRNLATGDLTVVVADYVVYATGYQPADLTQILGDASELCQWDEQGRPLVERDYRIKMVPGVTCGIYAQGSTEHSHGISSSLLSNVAVRAGEILASIGRQPPSGTPSVSRPVRALDAGRR